MIEASMGPRFFKRGESVDEPLDTIGSRDASMGPRFFKRGETVSGFLEPVPLLLQWGHASSSVESPVCRGVGL